MPPKQTHKAITVTAAIAAILCLFPFAQALGHGISHADQQAMLSGGLIQYIWLGATHMLTGYDHLLFLFGVIFFLTGFRDIVKFITAFTIGHSITLLLATLWGITANYYLVDAVIAISVMYKGFENIDGFPKYLNTKSPNLVWVVFGFGLIHGFGLSTRLQQLPLGHDGMVMRILSFNLGVELGQIVALIAMLMFMTAWNQRPSFAVFSRVANVGLIFAGGLLFLMQMHGYMHTRYPDDFGFSKDHHYHEHLRMKQSKTHSHGGKAHSHGDGKAHSHGDKPHNHGETGHSHGDKPHSHGGTGHSHGDKAHNHSDKVHTHDGKAHSHGDKSHNHNHGHSDKAHSHGDKAHHHGKTSTTRPKPLSQPQAPTSRPHSHGKTPRPHGSKGHTHGPNKHGHTHGPSSRPHSHGPTTQGHTHGKHGHTHGKHGHTHGSKGHTHGKDGHDHKDHSHDDNEDDE